MPSLQAPRSAAPARPAWRIASGRFAGGSAALALFLLGGCAAGDYPSLARWPAAHSNPALSGQMAAPAAPVVVQANPGPGCNEALALSIHAEFREALPTAESALKGTGSAQPGTPAWSGGNIALARLQQIHARLAQVLAPAENAYVADTIAHADEDAQVDPTPRPDGVKLAACRARLDTLATQEEAQIDRLHAMLSD